MIHSDRAGWPSEEFVTGRCSVIKRRPSPATRPSRYRRRCRGRYYGPTRMRGQEKVGCISALEKKTTPGSEEEWWIPQYIVQNVVLYATQPHTGNTLARSERRGRCEFCPRSHALPIPAHPSKYVPSHHAALVPSSVLPQHPLCNIPILHVANSGVLRKRGILPI